MWFCLLFLRKRISSCACWQRSLRKIAPRCSAHCLCRDHVVHRESVARPVDYPMQCQPIRCTAKEPTTATSYRPKAKVENKRWETINRLSRSMFAQCNAIWSALTCNHQRVCPLNSLMTLQYRCLSCRDFVSTLYNTKSTAFACSRVAHSMATMTKSTRQDRWLVCKKSHVKWINWRYFSIFQLESNEIYFTCCT